MVSSTYILSYIEFMLAICAPIAPGASICPTFIAVPPVEVIWPTFIELPPLLPKDADILAMETQSPLRPVFSPHVIAISFSFNP